MTTRCNTCRADVEPVAMRCAKGRPLRLCPRCGGPVATKFTLVERGRGQALGQRVGIYGIRRQP